MTEEEDNSVIVEEGLDVGSTPTHETPRVDNDGNPPPPRVLLKAKHKRVILISTDGADIDIQSPGFTKLELIGVLTAAAKLLLR